MRSYSGAAAPKSNPGFKGIEGRDFMKSILRALGLLTILLVIGALSANRALGQAQVANPSVRCVTIGADVVGTPNSQFVFTADITPSTGQALTNLPGVGSPAA